ncbi:hypothetical protein OOZ15_07795 [Galbibacter sp. EGI 63066]|uniref:hypothetical protein n=1 Tax=Galbibacter sp. EGI 63066 TaxID=2993559 RepID=UPI0022495F94|nr:hypothetical protein [Galbibacter sp. EGI 63066]MCX2679835.1 hypothetical protein [Galbibacter sp. EGI 63066]
MKKLIALSLFLLTLSGCEKETAQVLEGDFLYFADAAVLLTEEENYGVVIDKKMYELADQVALLKSEPTEMVLVVVRAKVSPKPKGAEGWANQLTIIEIIKVGS